MLTNRAQQGGAVMGTVIDIGLAGKGLITGAAKLAARNVDEVAEIGTRASAHTLETTLSKTVVEDIIAMPKGSRPAPSTYMSQAQIDAHLARFDDGAVRFRDTGYDTAGPPGGFVMTKGEFEDLLRETGGNLAETEAKLGFETGHLTSGRFEPVLIEPQDFNNIRVPSGNEGGANSNWIPGGFTSGGKAEAVMDFEGVDFTPIILD